jgi:hypothetical protein
MGRDARKIRVTSRTRTRRYRERLRRDGEPSSEAVLRALRQAFIEAVDEQRGRDVPEVTAFIASVAGGARLRLIAAGFDPELTRERLRQALRVRAAVAGAKP